MITLKGETILLRALEPTDLDYIFEVENEESLWEVGSTITPFSRFILKEYIDNSYRDIYDVKQLRLVICKNDNHLPVGLIDLYDFDQRNLKVGVGIVIFPDKEKQKGYAFEALNLVTKYAFERLNVHQVFAGITEDNVGSIRLFEKAGFVRNGIKKDWTFSRGVFKDEYFYQLIK
ncbi:MAG TPA: GNAT family N-acetyltransferase [Aequorivita sp.]|nr:GNAT family N-acetyltransferase [Aequorivita sp.]